MKCIITFSGDGKGKKKVTEKSNVSNRIKKINSNKKNNNNNNNNNNNKEEYKHHKVRKKRIVNVL